MPEEVNLLKLIPIRNVKWETKEDGCVVLLKPKFRHPFLVKLLLTRMKRPHFKVRLDEIGSFFWLNCDGTRTVYEIAELHKKKFGEKVEPLHERIALFLASLEKNRFILLFGKKSSNP